MNFQLLGSKPTRHGFGQGLLTLGERHNNVVAIGADVTGSVMTSMFKEKFPDRFFSVGVAEQNATTVAAGLALSGKIPFFSSYGAFAALRNADQIRISMCYNEANVKIGGSHSGVTVGPDGATHQVLEDIAFLRALPHLMLVAPCDYEETRKATILVGETFGPAYIRFGRDNQAMFTTEDTPFALGTMPIFREGSDVAIIACGVMVWEALLAAEELQKRHGISARVLNGAWIKPIDEEAIVCSARDCGAIVTAEEHQVHGGLGGAVAEVVVKNYPVPMEFVGMPDRFGESGEPRQLLEHFGLTWQSIYASALTVIARRDKKFPDTVRKVKDISRFTE
jgi:transketolase